MLRSFFRKLDENPIYVLETRFDNRKSKGIRKLLSSRERLFLILLVPSIFFLINLISTKGSMRPGGVTLALITTVIIASLLCFYYRAIAFSAHLIVEDKEKKIYFQIINSQMRSFDILIGKFWFVFRALWIDISTVWAALLLTSLIFSADGVIKLCPFWIGLYVFQMASIGTLIIVSLSVSAEKKASIQTLSGAMINVVWIVNLFLILSYLLLNTVFSHIANLFGRGISFTGIYYSYFDFQGIMSFLLFVVICILYFVVIAFVYSIFLTDRLMITPNRSLNMIVVDFLKKLNNNPLYVLSRYTKKRRNKWKFLSFLSGKFIYILILLPLIILSFGKISSVKETYAELLPIIFTPYSLCIFLVYFVFKGTDLSSMLIAQDHENGIYEQILSTGMKPKDIIVGKFWQVFLPLLKETVVLLLITVSFGLSVDVYHYCEYWDIVSIPAGLFVTVNVMNTSVILASLWMSARQKSKFSALISSLSLVFIVVASVIVLQLVFWHMYGDYFYYTLSESLFTDFELFFRYIFMNTLCFAIVGLKFYYLLKTELSKIPEK